MSAITLKRVIEAMENGLKELDCLIDSYGTKIYDLTDKRDAALAEAELQSQAVKALKKLESHDAEKGMQITLRFPG